MEKRQQTIIWKVDSENQATYRGQTVTDLEEVDGRVEGKWNGKDVVTWSLITNEWYVF